MVLTGREKATIFLSILGAENSARVLRYLPDELADLIAAGINHLPTPSPDALTEVLQEYQGYLALPEAEERFLAEAAAAAPTPVSRKNYQFLLFERPQMAAFLLHLLPENEKNEALMSLSRDKAIIEELLTSIKSNQLTNSIAAQLKITFAGKLF